MLSLLTRQHHDVTHAGCPLALGARRWTGNVWLTLEVLVAGKG